MGTVLAYTPILQPALASFNTPHGIPYMGSISFILFLFSWNRDRKELWIVYHRVFLKKVFHEYEEKMQEKMKMTEQKKN